jgi:tetratricopeptide (TPR) repeat protein
MKLIYRIIATCGIPVILTGTSLLAKAQLSPSPIDSCSKVSLDISTGEQINSPIKSSEHRVSNFKNLQPKKYDVLFKRGLEKLERGNYNAAIADFTQVITLVGNDSASYANRGIARQKKKDYKGAISDYTQAIRRRACNPLAYLNRGVAYYEMGDLKKANADFNQAIIFAPKLAAAYNNRGDVRLQLKRTQQAITDYNKVIELEPNNPDLYYKRGIVYKELANSQAAIKDFRRAASLYQQQGKRDKYENAMSAIRQLQQ